MRIHLNSQALELDTPTELDVFLAAPQMPLDLEDMTPENLNLGPGSRYLTGGYYRRGHLTTQVFPRPGRKPLDS